VNRAVQLEGAHNYRDLGGLPTPNGTTPFGRVIRGESPHRLTAQGIEQLLELGVGMVVDLRSEDEILLHPNPLATRATVQYKHIPLFASLQAQRQASAGQMPSLEMLYIGALELCRVAFTQVLDTIAESPSTTLLHCTAGKDRTGLVAMLLLGMAGVDRQSIVDDYALTENATVLLDDLHQSAVATGADPVQFRSLLTAKPETMQAVFDYLERYGGIRGYVQDCLKLEGNPLGAV
jgi:protein-tyrosine phosphatase